MITSSSGRTHSSFARILNAWTAAPGRDDLRTSLISRLLLLLFAGFLFVVTWASWPNLIVDCGREMYVPAALLSGKRLYGDVWYPYGPLAPWMNALLFRAFGTTLNTLYFAGLAVISGSALVLHSIARRFLPPVGALVCGLGFLAPQFQSTLFNGILPYSCAATSGALLTLLTLLFLLRHLEGRGRFNLFLAGTFAALAVVSKYECFFPCSVGLVGGVLLHAWQSERPGRLLQADAAALLPGACIWLAIYGWLIHTYGLEFLVHANWMSAPGSYFMQQYGAWWVRFTGFRIIPREVLTLAGRSVGALYVWYLLGFLLYRKQRLAATALVVMLALLPRSAGRLIPFLAWPVAGTLTAGNIVRCVLLLALAITGALLVRALIQRREAHYPVVLVSAGLALLLGATTPLKIDDFAYPRGMFLVVLGFGILLVLRSVLSRQPLHPALIVTTGMALAMALRVMMEIRPKGYALYSSSLLFLVFLIVLWWLANWATESAGPAYQTGSVAIYFGIYALLFFKMAAGLYPVLNWPSLHTPVGDIGRTAEHATLVRQFLPVLREAKLRGDQVLLVPEITGLYFIAGMICPSRYEVLTPGVLEPGKYTELFLRELERNPPELIVLSNRRTSEYGVDYFGIDYDQPLLQWIESRYRLSGEIGHFERRESAPLAALLYRLKH